MAALTEAEARARSALLDVESYRVHLDLTLPQPGEYGSRTEIRFRCRRPGEPTFAEVPPAGLRHLTLNGAVLDPALVSPDGRLPLDRLEASNVLVAEAVLPYATVTDGLHRFTDPTDGAAYLHAQCYPAVAPHMCAGFDQPDLRADTAMSVSAPAGWTCMGNGAVTHSPDHGQAGTWQMATVPKLPPFLLGLCAGPYATGHTEDYHGTGGPVKLAWHCRPALAGSPAFEPLSRILKRSLAFYERLFGIPCPDSKCDIVFVPELVPRAMSIPGLILVREETLRRSAEPGGDAFDEMIIAHEVAHLWFGSLVTFRWFSDEWLDEGLATYLSYTVLEAEGTRDGGSAPWAKFCSQQKPSAYLADTLPTTHPVSAEGDGTADRLSRSTAIVYGKGASMIKQLGALLGPDTLHAGLAGHLTRLAYGNAAVADLIASCSAAAGYDLTAWADEWLATSGVNRLIPELDVAADGTVSRLLIRQEPAPGSDILRTHKIGAGLYDLAEDGLRLRTTVPVTVTGSSTLAGQILGEPAPAVLLLNDGDLGYVRTAFDPTSYRALSRVAMDIGDPLAEALCWNSAWDMVRDGELPAAGFADLVIRRTARPRPCGCLEEIWANALDAADRYAPPEQRPGLRQSLTAAALTWLGRPTTPAVARRVLATAAAACAQDDEQLATLRSWLDNAPEGVTAGVDLRARILATLSARDLATEADLVALANSDQADGPAFAAQCRAMRPDPAAKQVAWSAALAENQLPALAAAHARGIWVPGQETLTRPFRDRYFSEALPTLAGRDPGTVKRLAAALFPALLAEPATADAAGAALDDPGLPTYLRKILLEQRTLLLQAIAARAMG